LHARHAAPALIRPKGRLALRARCSAELGGEAGLLPARGAWFARLEFCALEGVAAAMRAQSSGAQLVSLLGLLHPLPQVAVLFGR
jgi:hypothetical protein